MRRRFQNQIGTAVTEPWREQIGAGGTPGIWEISEIIDN